MNESPGFSVFFFPPALEALGDAIKPYLQDGPAGPHVPCRELDTAGAFIEMTLEGQSADGRHVEVELMVPGNMVRMVVSARSDVEFGFYNRRRTDSERHDERFLVRPALEPGLQPSPAPDAATAAHPVDEAPKPT